MDRFTRTTAIGLLALSIFPLASTADIDANSIVAEQNTISPAEVKQSTDNTPILEANAETGNDAATLSGSSDTLSVRFPSLERALIIATMVNLVIILFVLVLYFAKRRMQQFSPIPLAMPKRNNR